MKKQTAKKAFRIVLLAYPDNPSGTVVFDVFKKEGISIFSLIVERKVGKANWRRFQAKVLKDGLRAAVRRILQMMDLRMRKRTIVDLARKNGVPVHQVDRFNSPSCEKMLELLKPDLLVIASAPILKPEIFTKARKGCLNAHPGWLPVYRGLGANAYALTQGHAPGVTVHFIDPGVDTGPILVREKLKVRKNDTVAKINDRAVIRGAELLAETAKRIMTGKRIKPLVHEKSGTNYRSMEYRDVRKVNRLIRRKWESYAL